MQKQVFRSGPYAELIAQAVQVGDIIYLSGQVGVDERGSAPDDIVAQTVLAYQNVKAVLAEFGATLDNVVEETVFVTWQRPCRRFRRDFRREADGQRPEVAQTWRRDPAFKIDDDV